MLGTMGEFWANRNSVVTSGGGGSRSSSKPRRSKRVFISYSHEDSAVAQKIKNALAASGIEAIIDSESLKPGDDIRKFILEHIQSADATVSIISTASLLSAWVTLETATAIHLQKRLIGCFIDDSFLKIEFVDLAIDHAKAEADKIGEMIKSRIDKHRPFQDLTPLMYRYRELETRAAEIVGRFRDTACVDLRQEAFGEGLRRLLRSIKEAT